MNDSLVYLLDNNSLNSPHRTNFYYTLFVFNITDLTIKKNLTLTKACTKVVQALFERFINFKHYITKQCDNKSLCIPNKS